MEVDIEKFHTLGGNTLSEHQKNFSLYKKALQNDQSFDPTAFFKNLQPKNYQEEIFRIILLQSFKQYPELIDVLKSGNCILAKIALKDVNFLKELLRRYTIENKFTEELTPYVSYVTRVNLIYKLARLVEDEKVAEEFYKKIYARYGLKFAKPFLMKSNSDFIKEILHEFEVVLAEGDLILLHKKSPKLFEEYLKQHATRDYGIKLSTYLAKNDLNEFHKLSTQATFTLGKKYLKRYIYKYKSDLINNPNSLLLKLNKKKISTYLKADDMIKLFKNHLLKTQCYKYYDEINYLKYYPKRLRGYILFTAYKNVNGCELWENPSGVEKGLLAVLSLEDRLKFDFLHKYPVLLPLSEAISSLKAKINVTSEIKERGNLCVQLLEACLHNESYSEELLEILKYFYGRHKNDHGYSPVEFISYFVKNFNNLENLGKDYWDVIEEMMLLLELNGDYLHCKSELLGKFLIYQLLNGIECKETLVKFFKVVPNYCTNFSRLLGRCEKTCILRYPELITKIHTENKMIVSAKINYLNMILNYNKRNLKNNQINPYDYFDFWSQIIEHYKESNYWNTELIIKLLECKPQSQDEQAKYDEFWDTIRKTGAERGFNRDFYKWLLKKHPLVVLDNPNKLIGNISSYDKELLYVVNKLDFLGITEKLDACALEILSSESANKMPAIIYFSCQSKSVDLFINLCQKYSPDETCKINVKAEEIEKLLRIQVCLIRSFKNIAIPSKLLESLLLFCNGDYLKYSLQPLYFIMYHATEDNIEQPIFELLKRAVSVRKHTVHLAGALGSIYLQMKVFSMMANEEKNVSVKKYIFGKIYNNFINEKTSTSWELLRDNMNLITIHDSESLHKLKNINNVPKKFLNSYLIAVWDFFSSFQNKSEFELISYFNRNLNDPDLESFYVKVINSSLYNPNNEFVRDAEVFAANYLLIRNEDMDRRVDFVWNLIQTRTKDEREKHRIITNFCGIIRNKNPTILHKNLINKIIAKTHDLNLTNNILSMELLLNSTKFYVNWDNEHSMLTNFVIEQYDYLSGKYSPQILHFFKDFLMDFLNVCFCYDRNLNILKVIKLLLEHDVNKLGLLGFLMLPSDFKNYKKLMRDVISMLKNSPSIVLKVYLDKYLSRHPEFDDLK